MNKHTLSYLYCFITLTLTPLTATLAQSPIQQAFKQGQFAQAIEHWERQWPTLPTAQQVDVLLQLALAYQSLGLADNAFSALHLALPKTQSDPIRQSLVLGSLSDLYLRYRDFEQAEHYAKQSVELVCTPPDSPLACATAFNYQANLLSLQGIYPEALAHYRKSLALAQQAHAPVLTAKLRSNIVQIEWGKAAFETALAAMQALPDSHDKRLGLLKLAQLAIEHPEMKWVVYEILQAVSQQAKRFDDRRSAAYATGYLGKLYEQEQRYGEAERLTLKAIFMSFDAPERLYFWYWQLGRLYKAQDELPRARAAYQNAIEQLQDLRRATVRGYRLPPQSILKTADAVYFDLADLWLQTARQAPDDKQRQADLHKARETLELLKAVELENYFQDDCVTALQAKRKRIDNILTDTHTAVLYPMIFGQRVELLLSFAGGELKQFTLTSEDNQKANFADIDKIVKAFQPQLRNPKSNYRRLLLNSRQLETIFIKTIRPILDARQIRTLVVVPDRLLRTIPFAALHDGKEFLIQQYALAMIPGLTLTETPKRFKRDDIKMFMGGLSESRQGFSALPNVLHSIKHIKQVCPTETRPLVNHHFIKNRLKNNLVENRYTSLYFATHGQFTGQARSSFLLTYNDKLNLNELEQFMRISQFRDEPVELLTLSACETAVGDERSALGLAGIALKAGARSAIASLWQVDSRSTAQLMTTFYQRICKGPDTSKAQALQAAQKLIQKQYKHPYYWAAFLLIGNWF
jgi:CHAT domain-containing protein